MQHQDRDILIVDDDSDISEMLAELLTDEGYRVQQTRSPDEGMQALEAISGHCTILLDLVLAGGSGFDFIERARERIAQGRDVCILVVSGSPALHRLRLEPPVCGTILKPFSILDLLGALQNCGCGHPLKKAQG